MCMDNMDSMGSSSRKNSNSTSGCDCSGKLKLKIISGSTEKNYKLPSSFWLKDLSKIDDECGINFCCFDSHCLCCLIEILEGKDCFDPPSKKEQDLLKSLGASINERLACMCRVQSGSVTIRSIMS